MRAPNLDEFALVIATVRLVMNGNHIVVQMQNVPKIPCHAMQSKQNRTEQGMCYREKGEAVDQNFEQKHAQCQGLMTWSCD